MLVLRADTKDAIRFQLVKRRIIDVTPKLAVRRDHYDILSKLAGSKSSLIISEFITFIFDCQVFFKPLCFSNLLHDLILINPVFPVDKYDTNRFLITSGPVNAYIYNV